jgi:cobalt-zinc-cadmium efflux system membrane fusion protein
VEIGDDVKAADVVAYIDSREVGEAKLKFAQNELELQFAKETHDWYETVQDNTKDLLAALEGGKKIDEIEEGFRNRPIGNHREKLVSAFARAKHATADYERIRDLGEEDVLSEREVVHARAEFESANASYQAFLEQVRFDSQRQLLTAHQSLKAAESALAVSRSQLFILGFSAEDIAKMDPIAEADRVAYYPVRAPFDGTVIARDTVLSKHVDAESEIVEIADLSTVWLRADIFEKDLGAVHGLQGKSVEFLTTSYPDQPFSAKVFAAGNVIDDRTRAARLLAVAQNPQRLLKPGMFVEVDLNSGYDSDVILVPASAVQRHEGAAFVFVRRGQRQFERRGVKIGRSTSERIEILDGLDTNDPVVVDGGFALKSEMLSDLMVEE